MRERVCKNCGGREYKVVGQNMVKCAFCGTLYVDEQGSKEEEVLLVGARELAREFRFDEAVAEFDKILSLFPLSFEAHFGKTLAKNKILLYASKKGTATRPRFFGQIVSILEDEDFKEAVSLAPQETATSYQKTAKQIEKIKKDYDEKDSKNLYDIILCATGFDKDDPDEKVTKTYENLKKSGKNVYFLQDLPQKELESQTFTALQKSKCFLFFAQSKTGYAEFKHLLDRWQYFVSLRKKPKTSFILAIDEWVIAKENLPREFAFCKNVIDTNSISFLQDVEVLVQNEIENFVGQTAKIDTIKINKVEPIKKEYVDIESVVPEELGHYEVENVNLSEQNKIKWIFLCLKNGDFASAQELVDKELEKDPYNSELLFAQLLSERQINTSEEFFKSIFNFTDKEKIENILRYAPKDFAQTFVDNWEYLLISLNEEEYYCNFLIYLASFQTSNRENFIKAAEAKAVETLNEELIEKVQKCFDIEDVNRFVSFYFALAQKSNDEKYYHKILELDAGHFQSNMIVLLKNFKTAEDKLTYRNREEIENVFKYLNENARVQFVSAVVDLVLSVAFFDLSKAEEQLDFYLAYIPDEKKLAEISKKIALRFQQMNFFRQAEKYISIAISKDKQQGELYWILIQIKAHCRSENELIMSTVKVTQMPEWESLLEFSDDQHNEMYAGIVSKVNLYKGERIPFQNDLLDKVKMSEKLQDFLSRNEKILLEIEKQEGTAAQSGVNYYRCQLKPFEIYLNDIETETFDKYYDFVRKIQERLQNLDLSLDSSVNVTKLLQRCGQAKIVASKEKKKVEESKEAKSSAKTIPLEKGNKTKFIKKFLCIFLEFYPILFSTFLFFIAIFLPKSVFLYFSQEFLIISLIYSVVVGIANLILFVVRKRKSSKGWRAVFATIFGLGVLNLGLFCAGFYCCPNTIQISNAKEMNILLHNASYANFQLEEDVDFSGQNWGKCNFHGTIDGKGHKIINLSGGLFNNNSGKIKNLQVELSGVSLQNVGTFGAFCAYNTGNLQNCTVNGDIFVSTNKNLVFGGLIGKNVGGTIYACTSSLSITIQAQSNAIVGGVVGQMLAGKSDTKLQKNLFRNTISVFSSGAEVVVGGLAGSVYELSEKSDISQNVVSAEILLQGTSTKLYAGALVGVAEFASHDNRVSGQIFTGEMLGEGFVGGLIGSYVNADLTKEVLYSISSVELETLYECGSLFGQLGGRAKSCFAIGFEEDFNLVGKVLQYCGTVNCQNFPSWDGNPHAGFDLEVWNFSDATSPKLKWES